MFLTTSCYKDKEIFIPNQQYSINNDLLLAELTGTPTAILVNIENQDVISLPNNIWLVLPNNKVNSIGNNPVKGQVKIEFKEYTSPRSGLLNSYETTTTTDWIDGHKIIYLRITQDNQEINFKEAITLYFPTTKETENLNVYTLNNEGNIKQWSISMKLNSGLMYGDWLIYDNVFPSKEITGYKLTINQVNDWMLLGRSIGRKVVLDNPCYVEMPKTFNKTNSMVYFVSVEHNLYFKLDYNNYTSQFFTTNGIENQDLPGKLIFIGQLSEDKYYFGTTNVILGKDTNVQIESIGMSKEKIKAALMQL